MLCAHMCVCVRVSVGYKLLMALITCLNAINIWNASNSVLKVSDDGNDYDDGGDNDDDIYVI